MPSGFPAENATNGLYTGRMVLPAVKNRMQERREQMPDMGTVPPELGIQLPRTSVEKKEH